MIGRPSVIRAWFVGHDARTVVLASGAGTALLCIGAPWLLPSFLNPRPVQLWQLTPPLLAMVASLATVNGLPAGVGARVRLARAGWVLALVAGAAMCAHLVDSVGGLSTLVPETVVLVAMTVASSTVLGRGAVWIGAAAAVSVVIRYSTLSAFADPWSGVPTWGTGTIVAATAAGVMAYVVFGARSPRRS